MNRPAKAEMALDERVLKKVSARSARKIMLLGGSDAGKTTLAEALSDILSRKGRTGILDLDMGQSHIGPPTTLAWGLLEGGFKSWERIKAEEIYFTGALSPPGNMLPSIAGARLLMDNALARCSKLIIDTTGLISGPLGRLYKQYKVDLLRPDVILAVQETGELEHIISPYRLMRRPVIVRLPASPLAMAKGIPMRTGHREALFRAYFGGARSFEVDTYSCGVRYTREDDSATLEGRLISFRDRMDKDICLGIIERADNGKLIVRSPLKAGVEYSCIVIGRASVEL